MDLKYFTNEMEIKSEKDRETLQDMMMLYIYWTCRIFFWTGLAVSKMHNVRQSHAIKYVLYYGVQ